VLARKGGRMGKNHFALLRAVKVNNLFSFLLLGYPST